MFRNEFLKFQDKLYVIKKKLNEEYKPNVEAWKEWLGADIVLRRDNMLYFVEEVPDLEILPEEPFLEPLKD